MGHIAAVGASLLLLLLVGASSCGGEDPPPPGDYTDVLFAASDGVTLHGRTFGDGPVSVVLAHMYPADQRSWQPFAETLADEGYTALTFDFRGYGGSGGKKEIEKIHRDVEGAVQFMRDQGAGGIFLIGASMGGTAALKVAAKERFLGVITLSAPTEFQGLAVLEEMAEVDSPALFLAAEDDRPARHAAAALFSATGGQRLQEIYRGKDHGTDMLTGEFGEDVEGSLLDFLYAYTP